MDIHATNKIAAVHRAVKEIVDEIDTDRFSAQQLLVLLSIASKGRPVSQQELVNEAGSYNSTISKVISLLAGDKGSVRHKGLGLLKVEMGLEDMRSREVTLSDTGERLISRAVKRAFPKG